MSENVVQVPVMTKMAVLFFVVVVFVGANGESIDVYYRTVLTPGLNRQPNCRTISPTSLETRSRRQESAMSAADLRAATA